MGFEKIVIDEIVERKRSNHAGHARYRGQLRGFARAVQEPGTGYLLAAFVPSMLASCRS